MHWSKNMNRSSKGWGQGPFGVLWHVLAELTGNTGRRKRELGNQFGMLAIVCGLGVPAAYGLILFLFGELTWQMATGLVIFAVIVVWLFSSNDFIR